MATPHLARLAYASALHAPLSAAQLYAMLSQWRRCNAERAVTGVFLAHQDSVFHVLEGFPDVVQALFQAISRDPRHHQVTKLIDEPATQRSFGDWSMGLARVVPSADPEFRYWQCDEAMARALLAGFTTGPWRRSIS
jgi:hypothetical protein